jgi:hypothetical protein
MIKRFCDGCKKPLETWRDWDMTHATFLPKRLCIYYHLCQVCDAKYKIRLETIFEELQHD